jgi:four helix bundle protein
LRILLPIARLPPPGVPVALQRHMNQKAEELKERTHRFFVRVLKFCEALPRGIAALEIGKQLVDSAGATDSNYRAACRSRSTREFIAKVGIAAEEADESVSWLRALIAANIGEVHEARALMQEADELTRIFVKSGKTAALNLDATKTPRRPQSPIRNQQ